jgi:phosphoadenosine phosphosulfate reductase
LIDGKRPVAALQALAEQFPGEIVFSTSFGWEDQAITHMIFANNIPIKVFTLETGQAIPRNLLCLESHNGNLRQTRIHAYYPVHHLLEEMVNAKGPNSFYESVENRKECCGIRKIEPLHRALAGNQVLDNRHPCRAIA